jgi:hypothetical protein
MLRVIFYHVGKGDLSLVLLPNGEAMMIDCYKADELAQDAMTRDDSIFERIERTILRYRERAASTNASLRPAVEKERQRQKKIPIAALIITHADRDHITVRKKLREEFDIELLIDSGREYDASTDCMKDYLQFRKYMQDAGRYHPIPRATDNIWGASGATIDVLCPNRDVGWSEDNNSQCMVVRVEHNGWSFLFTGDSPWEDWADEKTGILTLHGSKPRAHILNASHHGSRTFFTPSGQRAPGQAEYTKEQFDRRGIRRISPVNSFITCSDDVDSEFPHPIALEVYQEETNREVAKGTASHVIMSRESKHMHYVVTDDGKLYSRTSFSRNNAVAPQDGRSYSLRGRVSGGNGYLTNRGIWVTRMPLSSSATLSFQVEAKGPWPREIEFDWWVLNNGQGRDQFHREFYTIASQDRKKQSKWDRPIVYEGVHLMQCHASADNGNIWANWCVLVCHQSSVNYAEQWLDLYPTCIDTRQINS